MPEPRCEEKTNTGDEEFLRQDFRGSVLKTHDNGTRCMRVETEELGHQGFSRGSHEPCPEKGFMCSSFDNDIEPQSCRTKHLYQHRESLENHSSNHGGQFPLQDYQVGSRRHEASLSHDQAGVCRGTESIWYESTISEHHSAGVTHTGEGTSHSGRTLPASRCTERCDEEDRPSKEGRAEGNVCQSFDRPISQSHGGRDASSLTCECDRSGNQRHSAGDRQTCWDGISRDSHELPELCRMGETGGGQGDRRSRLATSSTGVMGSSYERADRGGGNIPSSDDARQGHSCCQAKGDRQVRICDKGRRSRDLSGTSAGRDACRDCRVEVSQRSGEVTQEAEHGSDVSFRRKLRGSTSIEGEASEIDDDNEEDQSCLRELSERKLKALDVSRQLIVQEAWASVSEANRLFLLEVACSQDSVLSTEASEKYGKACQRCSIWNGFDLTTGEGVKRVIQVLRDKRPLYVWLATECGPFSPIQNCNQKTPQQRDDLKRKQLEARKQHVGGLVVAYMAHKLGCVVGWEWSRRCRAWKWDMIDEWRKRCETKTAIIAGCQVGLKDPKTSKPLGKEWRVECTSERLADKIHSPCQCAKGPGVHALCEGQLTRQSAFYTRDMARKIIYHMVHLEDQEHVSRSVNLVDGNKEHDLNCVGKDDPVFTCCWCKKIHAYNKELSCVCCVQQVIEQGLVGEDVPRVDQGLSDEDKKRIRRQLNLIHCSTGHGSYHLLIKALQRRNVDPQVLELAREFRCSVCEERKRPDPRRQANLEVHSERWKSIQVDAAFWRHPTSGQQIQFVVMLDESSRFAVAAMVQQSGGRGVKAGDYIDIFEKFWKPYFGMPDVVRTDPEGAWRSQEIDDYFERRGIQQDCIPAEAHWNLTHVERTIEWLRNF